MSDLRSLIYRAVATVFFVGHLPIAPGTWGSLAAMLLVAALKPTLGQLLLTIAVTLIVGVICAGAAEKIYGKHDAGCIVIDEVVGYCIAVVALPMTLGYLIAAFFLFRFFDILKPPPIRNLERIVSGGLGIMLDDVLAGIATNVLLHLARLLF